LTAGSLINSFVLKPAVTNYGIQAVATTIGAPVALVGLAHFGAQRFGLYDKAYDKIKQAGNYFNSWIFPAN